MKSWILLAPLRRALVLGLLAALAAVPAAGGGIFKPIRRDLGELTRLSRESFAARVYPSLTYHLMLNRSPAIIGADVFHAATGANGEGVKIGVVDDGIDNTNPFLSGAGFTAPPGFPIGDPRFTSN